MHKEVFHKIYKRGITSMMYQSMKSKFLQNNYWGEPFGKASSRNIKYYKVVNVCNQDMIEKLD